MQGMKMRSLLVNGEVRELGTPIVSSECRVEIVLAKEEGVMISVLDAESKLPVWVMHGRGSFTSAGSHTADFSFETDLRGQAWIRASADPRDSSPPAPDGAVLSGWPEGYLQEARDIELHEGSPPVQIALEPDSAYACCRGRVMRAGKPVPEIELGMRIQRRNGPGFDYKRVNAGADGRFAIRWRSQAPDDSIAVFPHWKRWDEFGFLGPMSVEEASSGEHVLELDSSVRVPVILRNVIRSDRYRYYVAIVDGDVAISTTINGAPVAVDQDGEAHTTMLLPKNTRASVTIGFLGEGYFRTDASPPVSYDPANRTQPLVFDVESMYARV